MYEPEVTIITPTSNIVDKGQADDFTLLVNLLDRQTYEFVDHLIIDNASQDGTEVLLKEYKNSGFLTFYSEPDRGKFDAMNKGLLRAKGKYVAFLSCDDFIMILQGLLMSLMLWKKKMQIFVSSHHIAAILKDMYFNLFLQCLILFKLHRVQDRLCFSKICVK